MGVIYKLRQEVVDFIISQRESNPLFSCRQLAEAASLKFGLNLSKSSVHDVLKESGIVTPRGRKPKEKFKIPQEKKKQIQISLSQVKLLPAPVEEDEHVPAVTVPFPEVILSETKDLNKTNPIKDEYEGAGRIFLKAAFWDLGIFSREENIKEVDWKYYLTYSKGIKVVLEDNKSFFIDLPLPLERCIRETADGLINNVKTLMVHNVSDEALFKACMEGQSGFRIDNISIVDQNDYFIVEFGNIVELKRKYKRINRTFVENFEKNVLERAKKLFFPQNTDDIWLTEKVLNLKGFNAAAKDEITINLLINDKSDKQVLQNAIDILNTMYLYNEQDKLVSVKIC